MAKRGNNEGSVYRRKDGKWVGAVTLGYNANGNPKRRVVYGDTRAEAARKLTELLDRYNKGLLAEPDAVTLRQFAEGWLERETRGKAANTRRLYTQELEHALRFLGDMKLQAIKPVHVRAMVDRMQREGWTPRPTKRDPNPEPRPYSARTIRKALQRLQGVFQDALRLELIHRNPCDAVRFKAPPSEPVGRSLEPSEALALFEAADRHRAGLVVQLMLLTGLRRGEALALRWRDIDLEATPPYLRVVGNWTRAEKNHMSRLKTPRAKRTVPLAPELAERLRRRKEGLLSDYPAQAVEGWFVFALPGAEHPYTPTYTANVLEALCREAGIPRIRTHDLRHTFGSLLLARGEKLERVSELLGHASPVLTLSVYRHLLSDERNTPPLSLSDFMPVTPGPKHTA
jgi:integrase